MVTNVYNPDPCEAEAGRLCGGLNKNGHYRLICLNACLSGSVTMQERLGGVVLLEVVYQWGLALRFQKAHAGPSVFLCLLPIVVYRM